MSRGEISTALSRRDALKAAAAAGTVAWVAPVVLAQPANAFEGCTEACAPPEGTITLANEVVVKLGCFEDTALGTQRYELEYAANATYTGPDCDCTMVQPTLIGGVTLTGVGGVSKPGNQTFDVTFSDPGIRILCKDRQGNCLIRDFEVVATVETTGNCQEQTGNVTLVSSSIGNSSVICVPALECPG